MESRIGDWDRPCTACGKTPQDGAVFYGRTKNKASRLSQCSKCMNKKYEAPASTKLHNKMKRELSDVQMELRLLQARINTLIGLLE